jgi:hypothetical protein
MLGVASVMNADEKNEATELFAHASSDCDA